MTKEVASSFLRQVAEDPSEQQEIVDETIEQRPKGIRKLINFMAASFRTIAIWYSVFSILTLTGVGLIPIILVATLVSGTYGLKDYFKTQSARQDGDELYASVYTPSQKFKAIAGVILSFLCGLAMESLFVAGIITSAVAIFSPQIALAIVITVSVMAVVAMFSDTMFYWNCFRKFFILPKEPKDISESKAVWVKKAFIAYLIISSTASSILYCASSIMATAAICGLLGGPIGAMVGIGIGIAIGLAGFVGNMVIMFETHRAWSNIYQTETSKPTSFIEKITTFKQEYVKTLIRRTSAYGDATAGALPVVHAILTNPVISSAPVVFLIGLGLITLFATTVSEYSFGRSTINRFFKHKKENKQPFDTLEKSTTQSEPKQAKPESHNLPAAVINPITTGYSSPKRLNTIFTDAPASYGTMLLTQNTPKRL